MAPLPVAVHVGQLLQPVPGGIGRYVRGLLAALPEVGADPLPFAAGPRPDAVGPGYVDLGRPHGPWRYELWHRLRRPRLPRRLAAGVVHAPSLAVPPPGGRSLVVTVHDLVFLRLPELLTPRGVAFHRRGLELARREAGAVVVPTAHGKDELVAEGFDPETVHVAPHGVDVPPAPVATGPGTRGASTLESLGVRRPYLLFVGTLEPRKGVDDVLAAGARVRAAHPDADLRVVLAGPPGWGPAPDASLPWVAATGPVGDAELDALYRGAVALVLPSRYEGFGLPVIEAMARGCPVVTSDAACLPEVGGGAAGVVPVGDVDALAAALDRILTDDGHRAAMAAAGRARASAFTWAASARAHIAAYAAALALAPR